MADQKNTHSAKSTLPRTGQDIVKPKTEAPTGGSKPKTDQDIVKP